MQKLESNSIELNFKGANAKEKQICGKNVLNGCI